MSLKSKLYGTLLALLVAAPLAADPVRFGARSLDIPPPREHVPIGEAVPKLIEISQAYLPPANRLVEIYVAPEDRATLLAGQPAAMERYFQLQVLRKYDGTPLSSTDFTQAAEQIDREMREVAGTLEGNAEELTEAGNKVLQEETGDDSKVSLSGVQYHGAFRREPWGTFFTISTNLAVTGQADRRMVSAGSVALINHQLLYLYAYAGGTDEAASRRWAEGAVSAWADAVRAVNPDDPAVAAQARSLGTGLDWGRVGGKALIGALIGGAIGLFYFLFKRNKS